MSTQIAVLIGSLRRDSYNRRLARAVQRLAPQEFVFKDVQISDLPLYNLRVDDKFFTRDGDIASADSRKFMQGWMDAYVAWVRRLADRDR